jgi:hypothetical protein
MDETGELVEVGTVVGWAAPTLKATSKARELVATGIWLVTMLLKMAMWLTPDKQKAGKGPEARQTIAQGKRSAALGKQPK